MKKVTTIILIMLSIVIFIALFRIFAIRNVYSSASVRSEKIMDIVIQENYDTCCNDCSISNNTINCKSGLNNEYCTDFFEKNPNMDKSCLAIQ